MSLSLYIVSRTSGVGWDEYDQHLIAAHTPTAARKIAAEFPQGDDRADDWAPGKATVRKVGFKSAPTGKPGILLSSFCAG